MSGPPGSKTPTTTCSGSRRSARRLPFADQVGALRDVLAVMVAQPAEDVLRAGRIRVLPLAVDDWSFALPIGSIERRDRLEDRRVQIFHLIERRPPIVGLQPAPGPIER